MTPVLRLREVTRVYGRGTSAVVALDRCSFEVCRGELVAVCGPSGSGKSTLMQIAGLLDEPTSGIVELFGSRCRLGDRKGTAALRARHLGFVFQQPVLVARSRCIDSVADGLLYLGVPRRERLRRAQSQLDQIGLGAKGNVRAGLLSGGEQQRVAIARALIRDPEILLADEPTASLDRENGDVVQAILRELAVGGTGVLVITHDEQVAARCDRTLFLRDGGFREA
jgi:putative ABC transport system ATP-binding protein